MRTHAALARLSALLAGLASGVALAETIEGRVIAILDGDSFVLLDRKGAQHRIRLAAADAPEWGQRGRVRSKENLSRLVAERDVRAHCDETDPSGRRVCKVLQGSADVGLEQIRAGYAWWVRDHARDQPAEDRAEYERSERQARDAKRGLWKDTHPVPPWEWRKPR